MFPAHEVVNENERDRPKLHRTDGRQTPCRPAGGFPCGGPGVFDEKGYAEATLDDVIGRSGGSRQTLYALFGGKQGLFEAIISENCETIFQGLTPEHLGLARAR